MTDDELLQHLYHVKKNFGGANSYMIRRKCNTLQEVCEMLVGIDNEGKKVVRTPKAKQLWDELMLLSGGTSYEQAAETFAEL